MNSGDAASVSSRFARAPEAERTWVDETLPPFAVPYAKLVRLDRPAGVYLLAWPCLWSIALAAPPGCPPDPYLSSLFCAGAFLLRGAGCTVNDLWDRDIDKLVARTRNRPIASGAVSPTAALVFLAAQLGAGAGILLQLNDFSKALGASSLAPESTVGGETTCSICMVEPKTHAAAPCGHLCVCIHCSQTPTIATECPICRQKPDYYMQIHVA